MTITIIGAGLAGLLAANMLSRHHPSVVEQQAALPHSNASVLRFRSSLVGDTLGIPFKKVHMVKAVLSWRNTVADTLAYAFKNTGRRSTDRSIIEGSVVADRWIAPPDLIARMAANVDITFGQASIFDGHGPYISSVPMPILMRLIDYPHLHQFDFHHSPATTIRATVPDCDAYCSLLVPNPDLPFTRISLTGDELSIEVPGSELNYDEAGSILAQATQLLGVDSLTEVRVSSSKYAKILPIDDDARKQFIHWATTTHNIYSIGRYGLWKPKLLLDDLPKDIRKIEGWITNGHLYDAAKQQ